MFTLGEPCNVDGRPLDLNSPEPTINIKDPDDWTPYDSRLAFETAEFAYKRCKMSAGNFDILSQLWAASLAPYDDAPPFASHSDLCKTIDSTPIGGIPWRSISLSYNDEARQCSTLDAGQVYRFVSRSSHAFQEHA